jgi:hypothetical protein
LSSSSSSSVETNNTITINGQTLNIKTLISSSGTNPPPPPPPPGPVPKPSEGIEQPEKGGNKDPNTWKIVHMKDNPALFKVVDNKGINICVEFTTAEIAQQYIDWAKWEYTHPINPPPPPPPCPSGQHWDAAQGKCVDDSVSPPPPPPPIEGDRDLEGIQKLYPDDPTQQAQTFYLAREGPNHERVSGKGARQITNGITQITPDKGTNPPTARIYIRTTNPKAMDVNTQLESAKDWQKMAAQKYMVGPEDYRNAEVSAYYKITKSSGEDEFTFYWMGGAHPSDDTWPLQCVSCCNKAQVKMDMTPRAAKEYHHYQSPAGYAWNPKPALFDLKSALGGSMVGKMIGQKLVMYVDEDANGKPTKVHMELYVDTESKDLPKPDYSKQRWRLFCEWIDDGTNWPDPKNSEYIQQCKGTKGQLISWGGPYIALRLDNNIWELHSLSVRPIIPTKL